MYKTKGFTLIELLIVITVISILVAILIPNMLKAKDLANETAAKGNIKTFNLAEIGYYHDNAKFGNFSDLVNSQFINTKLCADNGCILSGYSYSLDVLPDNYRLIAAPLNQKSKQFCSDATGTVSNC